MGREKSIASGKEHREPYRKSKRRDRTCRNHGSCSYCVANRLHRQAKNDQETIEDQRQPE